MIQNDILLKHLSTVFDPELGANIVELGYDKDIQHVDKTVKIKLALTIADCPMRNQIETEINRKLKLLENVENVVITITAMDQKDRTAVMEKAREKARENAQPYKCRTSNKSDCYWKWERRSWEINFVCKHCFGFSKKRI